MSNFNQVLLEIAEKIEILRVKELTTDQNWIVRHPDYPALELEPDLIASLQQIAPQLQAKYLTVQVQNYLYDLYFNHSLISVAEIAIADAQPIQIKNNTVNGVDLDLCRQLERGNNGHGYIDRDWQVVEITDDDELIVVKNGLHLYIEPKLHLPKDLPPVKIGDIVPIYLPHNLIGQDTYIAVGNLGQPNGGALVQIYFNFTPTAAIETTQVLIPALNKLGLPFQLEILHHPDLFHRYDAGVLWLNQPDYAAAKPVLAEIYQTHRTEFSPNLPLFSHQLAPGLGLVEVPNLTSSFGMQQCGLLAIGLLAAMDQGKTTVAEKMVIIRQTLIAAGGIWPEPDLDRAQNLLSPNLYSLFG